MASVALELVYPGYSGYPVIPGEFWYPPGGLSALAGLYLACILYLFV